MDTYQLNFNRCLDKKHEGMALRAIIKLPPGALQGLSSKSDKLLAALHIKTIEDLGRWRHFRAARAIAALAPSEEAGGRPAGSSSNINGILDKQHEASSLQDILALPPSALQGLGPMSDELLAALGVRSVADLADWKFAVWADALATLAEHEREDFSSP